MRHHPGLALALLLLTPFAMAQDSAKTVSAEKFVGGLWFDGNGFRQATFYSVGGLLTRKKPFGTIHTVDLKGGYVVPAYGDAHSHFPDSDNTMNWANSRLLDSGVFYVLNPNDIAEQSAPLRDVVGKPATVDVLFAHAGFTCSGGHPTALYERLIDQKVYSYSKSALEGRAFYSVESLHDIEIKWPAFLATRPDFVKLYLLHSERYAVQNPAVHSQGLRPELLGELVRRAHAAGLRTGAHVETAMDFHNAVSGGVDWIMHLPGCYWPAGDTRDDYLISSADAALAHKHKVVVVTTVDVADPVSGDPDRLQLIRATEAENLRRLKNAGVKVVIGTDGFPGNIATEVGDLRSTGVFTNLELVRMLAETTPRAIFPGRRIGRVANNYEANFLVLNGNPISDISALKSIALRVKQGQIVK